MWLGSCIAVAMAVAMAGSYSSDSIPSLGTSICHRCGPKKAKTNKQTKNQTKQNNEKVLLERER